MKNEQRVLEVIKKFHKKLPKFADGRINYSKSDTAPVITVFIKYKNKILLLKRSNNVSTYKGIWNTVAGYLDELKPLKEKTLEELNEELGIREDAILSLSLGKSYQFRDTNIDKTWIVYPALVELDKEPKIKLDREHTDYKWIKPDEIKNFDVVPHLLKSFRAVVN